MLPKQSTTTVQTSLRGFSTTSAKTMAFYMGAMAIEVIIFSRNLLGKGARKKKPEKMWSFAKLPSDPPPVWHLKKKKKIPPFFLLKIASLMAETNFTLGPTSKTNKFHLLFLVIVGQNSQHKRANLNGRTPLDIYSNNFRPSVKHVLGVLE